MSSGGEAHVRASLYRPGASAAGRQRRHGVPPLLYWCMHAGFFNDIFKGFLRGKAQDIAAWVAENGVDGASNFIADALAAAGETELAEAVRLSGDFVESTISTMMDATACAGSTRTAATIGSVAGPLGAVFVGGIAFAVNPSCRDALEGVLQTGGDLVDAVDAAVDVAEEPQCGSGTVFAEDTVACADYCDSVSQGWSVCWLARPPCIPCPSSAPAWPAICCPRALATAR